MSRIYTPLHLVAFMAVRGQHMLLYTYELVIFKKDKMLVITPHPLFYTITIKKLVLMSRALGNRKDPIKQLLWASPYKAER
jgi:hypothetical protein